MDNPNCDGDKCRSPRGQVRVLPTGGDGNLIVCITCFQNEIAFRRDRNRELSDDCKFDLPMWTDLKVYGS